MQTIRFDDKQTVTFQKRFAIFVSVPSTLLKMSEKKITANQKQILVDYMQKNFTGLVGKFGNLEGRINKDNKWKEICDTLNSFGPPVKDAIKWKKCWTDMKCEVKKKLQVQRANRNQTGASPINIAFSELDDRIISIVGKQLLDGDPSIDEIGFDPSYDDGELIIF